MRNNATNVAIYRKLFIYLFHSYKTNLKIKNGNSYKFGTIKAKNASR